MPFLMLFLTAGCTCSGAAFFLTEEEGRDSPRSGEGGAMTEPWSGSSRNPSPRMGSSISARRSQLRSVSPPRRSSVSPRRVVPPTQPPPPLSLGNQGSSIPSSLLHGAMRLSPRHDSGADGSPNTSNHPSTASTPSHSPRLGNLPHSGGSSPPPSLSRRCSTSVGFSHAAAPLVSVSVVRFAGGGRDASGQSSPLHGMSEQDRQRPGGVLFMLTDRPLFVACPFPLHLLIPDFSFCCILALQPRLLAPADPPQPTCDSLKCTDMGVAVDPYSVTPCIFLNFCKTNCKVAEMRSLAGGAVTPQCLHVKVDVAAFSPPPALFGIVTRWVVLFTVVVLALQSAASLGAQPSAFDEEGTFLSPCPCPFGFQK